MLRDRDPPPIYIKYLVVFIPAQFILTTTFTENMYKKNPTSSSLLMPRNLTREAGSNQYFSDASIDKLRVCDLS